MVAGTARHAQAAIPSINGPPAPIDAVAKSSAVPIQASGSDAATMETTPGGDVRREARNPATTPKQKAATSADPHNARVVRKRSETITMTGVDEAITVDLTEIERGEIREKVEETCFGHVIEDRRCRRNESESSTAHGALERHAQRRRRGSSEEIPDRGSAVHTSRARTRRAGRSVVQPRHDVGKFPQHVGRLRRVLRSDRRQSVAASRLLDRLHQ
jgi:hypothetical protein